MTHWVFVHARILINAHGLALRTVDRIPG